MAAQMLSCRPYTLEGWACAVPSTLGEFAYETRREFEIDVT
jgi:hypothetical protein